MHKNTHHSWVFSIVALLSIAVVVKGATIRVDHESTTNGPGTSTWSNAWTNIQDALDFAESQTGAHDLWIADGVYFPEVEATPNDPTSVTFVMLEDVKLYGGFQGISRSGGGETALNQRNVDLYETVLSGNIGNPSSITDNARKVVTADGTSIDSDARLNGLTIRDAYSGFAMWLRNGAAPLVIRCTFLDNYGNSSSGGALRIDGTVQDPQNGPQFLACTFANNIENSHAAIYIVIPLSVTFVNCLMYGNEGYTGSVIWANDNSSLTMINCTVTDNLVPIVGNTAAIKFIGVDCTISNCVLWGNTNVTGQTESAQVDLTASGTLVVKNCDIQGLDDFAGNGNIYVDPGFVSAGSDDYRIAYTSLLLNNGDASDLIADSFDIDDDSDSTEAVPSRDMLNRKVNPTGCVDIGAYENQVVSDCPEDITSSNGLPDGVVNIYDLLRVIAVFATPGGIVDFYPSPCGNGAVGVHELLAVISAWGTCEEAVGMPESIEDCFNIYCAGLSGAEFTDCIEKCAEAVCEANPEECQ